MATLTCYGGPLDGYQVPVERCQTEVIDFPLSQKRVEFASNYACGVYEPSDYPNLGIGRYALAAEGLRFIKTVKP